MMTLEKLRENNPNLPIYSVMDPAFSRYGRVLQETAMLLRFPNWRRSA